MPTCVSQAQSWPGMPVRVLCGIDDGVRYLAGGGASGPPIDERDRLRQDCARPLMPAAGLKIRYNMSQSPMQIIQAPTFRPEDYQTGGCSLPRVKKIRFVIPIICFSALALGFWT